MINAFKKHALPLQLLLCCMMFSAQTSAHIPEHKPAHPAAASEPVVSANLALPPATVDTTIPSEVWSNPRWQHGPMTAELGHVASLVVPAGFRYLPPPRTSIDRNASGTGAVSDASGDPSSDSLTAVIAPEDGSWTMRVALAYTGHIDTSDIYLEQEDLARTMEIRSSSFDPLFAASEQSVPDLVEINWIRAPRWDANKHTLDWLYENKTTGMRGIQDTSFLNAALLGNRYTIALQTQFDGADGKRRAMALEKSFDSLIAGVKFHDAEAYANFRDGEPMAKLKLTDYITGPETEDEKRFNDKVARSMGINWNGLAVRLLPLLGLASLAWGRAQLKKQAKRDEPVT
jgi:uncharacterized membrane-anchored protein